MKTRVISGVVGIAIFIGVIYFMPPIVAVIAYSLICALAAYEFLGTTKFVNRGLFLSVCVLAALAVPSITIYSASFNILTLIYVLTIVIFLLAIFNPEKVTVDQIAKAYLGAIIIPFLLSSVIRIFMLAQNGSVYVLMPFVAAWCSDSGALLGGIMFGKHKLAPLISPKKTIEGAIGGVVGGVVGMLIFGLVATFFFKIEVNYGVLAVAGVAGSIVGQLGDLSFSFIKRGAGIKDFGKIMPGHGGVLDRFDSVIFTAPLFEIILHFLKLL